MDQVSPYLMCAGIFCVWPLLLFGLGYYLGRNGSPIEMHWKGIKGLRGRRHDPDDY